MLELAKQYAKLKKTAILDHAIRQDKIVFILASGPKLTMTERIESEDRKNVGSVGGEYPAYRSTRAKRGKTKRKAKS